MATRVGYIGLGDMGKAMASNLAPGGFDGLVYDLELGRSCGISLPAAGLVAQDMARIYRVNDGGRR
jgi:3-hydroxyisobutyrate dehydrogenase-like beta-hydroxyacid dehydrogenase